MDLISKLIQLLRYKPEDKEPKEGTFRIARVEMQDGQIFFYNEEYFRDRSKYIDRVQIVSSSRDKSTKGWFFDIPKGEKVDGEYTARIRNWFRYPKKHPSLEEAALEQLVLTSKGVREVTYFDIG